MNLRPYQQEAVDAVYNYLREHDDNPCVVLPTGCHAKGHPILMFDGSVKAVESIKVGDVIMGADSTPRHVLALARGREQMAKIIPNKGESFIVNVNHILSLVSTNEGIANITVADYMLLPEYNKKSLKLYHAIKNPLRTGFKVELLPEDNFYGFALDGNHLYVDGNFLVHHNTGKSVVIGRIASDAVIQWNGRVLILAHVKELLEQNAAKIVSLCPEIPVGIFSAGLKSRDTDEPIIVAGIQSVYNKACDLGSFDLILVDEAHLIAPDGEGMYRTSLNDMKVINTNVHVIGLTAKPYRLKGGLICKPENMLNAVCYDAGLKEMINQGYLSPLVSRAGRAEAKLSNLHVRGGEFLNTEIVAAMDQKEITDAACEEIVELTKERKSVLIFCTSVEHCEHVMERLRFLGQVCEMVTGETSAAERAELLERFKGKEIPLDLFGNMKPPLKYLCNVSVLTTGFDAPNVDCVVLLRPTASPGLLVQMVGRGLRLSPATGKTDCLILDYGENILRHGPIDCITVKEKSNGKGGEAPAKKCPECLALIHAGYGKCPECGYEFPVGEGSNLQGKASTAAVLSGQVSYTEYNVGAVRYSIHAKRGMSDDVPKTMRVDYEIGFHQFKSEWVCPEHSGYARNKFVKWWKERCALGCPVPMTTGEAVDMAQNGLLAPVTAIKVKSVSGEKFDRIAAWTFGERPILPDFYKTETDEMADSDIWSVEMDDNVPF
jgi:DNA repair protein RadD